MSTTEEPVEETERTYTHAEVLEWLEGEHELALQEMETQGLNPQLAYVMHMTFSGLENSWGLNALPEDTPEVILSMITSGAAMQAADEGRERFGL